MNTGVTTQGGMVELRYVLWAASVIVGLSLSMTAEAQQITSISSADELRELCDLGAPTLEDDDPEQQAQYHQRRRDAAHGVYETRIANFDTALMGYERIPGLLTISGFREYRPHSNAPSIRIRNECILSFEFEESEAHDIKAQIQMGTVDLRIGYRLAARTDYERHFCPVSGDDRRERRLEVDLLYAQLVEPNRGSDDGRDAEVIDTFYTELGHQWSLRRGARVIDLVQRSVPAVEISHLQWRRHGTSWSDDFGEPDNAEQLAALEDRLKPSLERAIYPCYIRVLGQNASLQGALVVEIPVDSATASGPAFLMDTLQMGGLRDCVEDQLAALEVISESIELDGVDALKATILMRRR